MSTIADEVARLHDLMTRGILSPQEYEAAKARVLGNPQATGQTEAPPAEWLLPAAPSAQTPQRHSARRGWTIAAAAGAIVATAAGAVMWNSRTPSDLRMEVTGTSCGVYEDDVRFNMIITNASSVPQTLGREDRLFATFRTHDGEITLGATSGWHGYSTDPDSMPAMAVTLNPGESTPDKATWPIDRDASAWFHDLTPGRAYKVIGWSFGLSPDDAKPVSWDGDFTFPADCPAD